MTISENIFFESLSLTKTASKYIDPFQYISTSIRFLNLFIILPTNFLIFLSLSREQKFEEHVKLLLSKNHMTLAS